MMACAEVEKFLHVWMDGEFADEDRAELERHLAGCPRCRELAAFEARFRDALRARLRRPRAPAGLRARVTLALDEADRAGAGPVPRLWRRPLPYAAAALAAAAALVLFLGLRPGAPQAVGDESLVEEAVGAHEKNFPLEVGSDPDNVRVLLRRVPVPGRLPRLAGGSAALVGARIGHMHGRDAALLRYRLNESPVTVHVFDASDVRLSGERRTVGNREVYVGSARGYSVVLYRDRGVGYAFTSDLDEDKMLELVSSSLPP